MFTPIYEPGVFAWSTAPAELKQQIDFEDDKALTIYLAVSGILPNGGYEAFPEINANAAGGMTLEVDFVKQDGPAAAVLNQIIHAFAVPENCHVDAAVILQNGKPAPTFAPSGSINKNPAKS